jgi:hypothetical protein
MPEIQRNQGANPGTPTSLQQSKHFTQYLPGCRKVLDDLSVFGNLNAIFMRLQIALNDFHPGARIVDCFPRSVWIRTGLADGLARHLILVKPCSSRLATTRLPIKPPTPSRGFLHQMLRVDWLVPCLTSPALEPG